MVSAVAQDVSAISDAAVWTALRAVPDPEIPVISVVDLGIVRNVTCNAREVTVVVTPTYAGCPATEAIEHDIKQALCALGATPHIVRQLDPPWSSAWLSPSARNALQQYGIAPPCTDQAGHVGRLTFKPRCPRCHALHTERLADFGATPCKALYRCLSCREPFEYFKPF